MTDKIKLERRGHTALITIDNPAANTWDQDNLGALASMIGTLNDDLDCYALVITGQGEKFFSAGADLNLFADGDPAKAQAMAEAFHEAFTALTHFRAYPLQPLMATQWVAASSAHCAAISGLPRHRRKWRYRKQP